MSGRVVLNLCMELLSDAIPGSGHSVPSGEDIAVCTDDKGYPYIKGSTVKGLLRESLTNLLAWTNGKQRDLEEILGVSGWDGAAEERRLYLTDLHLSEKPEDPEECYGTRTFTKLDGGVVESGTLRTAACVCRGLCFRGQVECAAEDTALLQEAFSLIKWMGTMRSRGFGCVRFTTEPAEKAEKKWNLQGAVCVRYRLHTELPVLITDAGNTHEFNSYETKGYIPGSAVRGMVMGYLAQRDPKWFEEHKETLLKKTDFLDAYPAQGKAAVIPSLMGFYEDKEEKQFVTVVKDGSFPAGLKRAKLGTFCALEQETVCYWKAKTGGTARLIRCDKDGKPRPFQVRYLSAGQDFDGYVLLPDAEVGKALSDAFSGDMWLGADRYEGFGKCSVTAVEAVEKPAWVTEYGYHTQAEVGTILYMLAVSPFTMIDELGNPCGLEETQLSKLLGVRARVTHCSTSVTEYDAYNRMWQSRAPALRMYERGSIFRIECEFAPALDCLRTLENRGIGVRLNEGYGRILFLRQDLFESLQKKCGVKNEEQGNRTGAEIRRARYTWLSEKAVDLRRDGLSKSQLGSIQAQCERAKAIGSTDELKAFLDKQCSGRGARHGARFDGVAALITDVLQKPVAETIGVRACEDRRLELLCDLIDHSRKLEEKEGR